MPHTSKRFLKAAATARAGKVHKKEAVKNVSGSSIELMDSTSESEGPVSKAGVTDKAETVECGWDGTVNHQPKAFHSSCDGSEWDPSSDESELEVLELEGEELLQSLGQCITKEQELLTAPMPFKRLRIGISASEWEKAEKNRHLGYNGLSTRTRQRHEHRAREKETRDAVQRQR